MHVIEARRYGGPEVLQPAEWERPPVGAGQVVVEMSATTVNPADVWIRSGGAAQMVPDLPVPFVPGWDITGTVEQDGATFDRGQRVAGLYPWMDRHDGHGTYADTVVADAGWLAPVPDQVDDVTAATLPLTGLAAAESLELLEVKHGDALLVTGASGAVGGFAVQLAARRGVRVAAVASPGDESYLQSLGADLVLTRQEPAALADTVRRRLPDGVAAVLDAASIGQSLLPVVLDRGIFLAVLGFTAPTPERDIAVRTLHVVPDSGRLADLLQLVSAGELRTRVAATLRLDQAAEGHRLAATGGQRGKVVLTV